MGPIDFQTREPVSPLFGALPHTNLAIELHASQEYTGQQRHMVWLAPKWKWVLDTDLGVAGRSTPVRDLSLKPGDVLNLRKFQTSCFAATLRVVRRIARRLRRGRPCESMLENSPR